MKIDLRELAWLHRNRVVAYSIITAIAFVPTIISRFNLAFGPAGSDFYAFWSAAKLAAAGTPHLAYSSEAMLAFQAEHFHRSSFFPFLNPPPFLLMVLPLALFPTPFALALWTGVTFTAWLTITAKLFGGSKWPLIAFPGAAVAIWHGQTGFLTGAILIGAIHCLTRRPAMSGILFGLMIVKPQLALLVPFALLAGRHYRVLGFACLSALGLLILSWAIFGSATITGYLGSAIFAQKILHGFDDHVLVRMITVYAGVKLIAGGLPAMIAQLVAALCMIALVIRVWRSGADPVAKGAVLVVADLLATPYAFAYDLPVLILPICWIAREGMRSGFRPWEKLALVAIYWSPLLCRAIAPATHLVSMPALLALTLFIIWTRLGLGDQESVTFSGAVIPARDSAAK